MLRYLYIFYSKTDCKSFIVVFRIERATKSNNLESNLIISGSKFTFFFYIYNLSNKKSLLQQKFLWNTIAFYAINSFFNHFYFEGAFVQQSLMLQVYSVFRIVFLETSKIPFKVLIST